MSATELLKKYGFQQSDNGIWTIYRHHISKQLDQNADREDSVSFIQRDTGYWHLTNEDGSEPKFKFETADVRDILAFAQTHIASSIFEVSGCPIDEGFSFEGTHYHAPFMFGDYFDFEIMRIGTDLWITHPHGEFGKAYTAWRDDFAKRVEAGTARAPEEFLDTPTDEPQI